MGVKSPEETQHHLLLFLADVASHGLVVILIPEVVMIEVKTVPSGSPGN